MKSIVTICICTVILLGCTQQQSSLDDEIVSLPDEWGAGWNVGQSSNNYAVLSRVMATTNIAERIRLARLVRDHFRHTPQWYVENGAGLHRDTVRFVFLDNCATRLISGENATPETILAGWRMNAEYLDDLEKIFELTENEWNGGRYRGCSSREYSKKWDLAKLMHHKYDSFFKYCFSLCIDSYKVLPSSYRPAFVEQIKRDFFHRKGMALVDLNEFPPEFRK